MRSRLDLSSSEVRDLGRAALDLVADYYDGLAVRRIMPDTTAAAVRTLLAGPLPAEGCAGAELLDTVRNIIVPLTRHNGHPRFFGYVASPGTAVTAIADWLASALNANVTSWRSAPAPTEIEHITIDWLKQAIGFPASAAGLFVSGGSIANFSALAAARSWKSPEVTRSGMGPQAKPLRVYVSEQGHFSIEKAAGLLGMGTQNVQQIQTGADFRIDLIELERRIEYDLANGYEPACVVASAGAVSTGAFDPLEPLAAIAERYKLWMHVDGAYGGFAALAPSARHLFRGIERAHSVTLDPHKWLYTAMGCGCVLYRDPEAARAAFGHQAAYTQPLGFAADESFAFWDFGPELSRRFRALGVWLQLKYFGTDALGEAIEGNLRCASFFEELVNSSKDFEMMAPVGLSIFCFRYAPENYAGDLDRLNERVLIELQRSGASYLSNASVRGRFALRGCVLNYRTTEDDMRLLLSDVRNAALRVTG